MTRWTTSFDRAVESVRDGQTVGIGGFLSHRHPMALVRALVRKGVRDLTIVAPGGGIDLDLLLAFGLARRVVIGVCSLDFVGLAPAFRRAAEDGRVGIVDIGGGALARSLEAASRGLAELPGRFLFGSDIRNFHPGRPDPDDPALMHMSALHLDLALVHADRADIDGNLRFAAPSLDLAIAGAARDMVVSVERILPRDRLSGWGCAGLPRAKVTRAIEAPLGAHPTSCHPDYATDYDAIIDYAEAVENGTGRDDLHRRWIGGNEEAYRRAIPAARLLELRMLAEAGALR